ncbi:methyltransferase [Flavobacterium akiainvivens]|uniref:Methyltransferase n=1 Tax=Flavobacterium akiainvivens TaxID=1202724 RepID=A0A0M8MIY6_9FLAO|nr:class I SAM-dependent methyltransferase [Flavobacterium akiainvivens]KOS06767.1 methyltransferase [Flavobacterium akiainvivens]SFQ77054.1 Methyltransferase domain-containing protein [Flavobacterium akiainvivens]
MKDTWTQRWDDRYKDEAFAYGEAPNNYLKSQLEKLPAGKILFAAEGEGRNAVFAAQMGWHAHAFDISEEGKKKALQLAEANNVAVDYRIGELSQLGYSEAEFDAVALVYAHFPAEIKSDYHKMLVRYLKPGGVVIFEAFAKQHLEYVTKNPAVGGPKDIESLFSLDEIKADFEDFDFITLEETEIELSEGVYHNGTGFVIRFVAKKALI